MYRAEIMDDKSVPSILAVDSTSPAKLEAGCESPDHITEETQSRLEKLLKEHGATWDSPDDPNDPYNWPSIRKNTIGVLYSVGGLITLMSASMIAAALDDIIHDLDIDASTAQIVFSTYFLGLGFGPFIIAALAEMHGRKIVWVYSQLFYLVWNVLSPVGSNKGLMIVGRLLSGFGASAGITLTGPVMADMYGSASRGKSLAIASFLPYLGPALGPILGGVIAEHLHYRWIFWIMSILNAALTLFGLFSIHESYTPTLLRHKAAATITTSQTEPFWSRFKTNLARPISLLTRRPIIQVFALILSLNFGMYSVLLSTYATLFLSDKYHQSKTYASLHYISISVGATLVSQVGSRFMDWIYARLCRRASTTDDGSSGDDGVVVVGKPEYRVPYLVPGFVFVAAGAFMYGWSARYSLHWIVVDVGAMIFTMGNFVVSQGLLAYQLDEFGAEYGASAGAASRLLMYIVGFVFPVFAPGLYERLGYGWGNSMLGFGWIVLGWPIPVGLWVWGARVRGAVWGKGGRK